MFSLIDLFAGVGGFTEGFSSARVGGKQLYAPKLLVDNDPKAAASFRYNRQSIPYLVADLSDITPGMLLEEAGIPEGGLDVLIGGPPCQGFSVLRRNKAHDDPRNELVSVFLRFVLDLEPKLVLMENVPNFQTVAKGAIWDSVFASLHDKYVVGSEVLNAYDYGVPQWRKRTFVAGLRRDLGITEFEFPMVRESRKAAAKRLMPNANHDKLLPLVKPWVSVGDAIGDLPSIRAGEEADYYDRRPFSDYQAARRKDSVLLRNHVARKHEASFLDKLAKIDEGGSNFELDGRKKFDRQREIKYLSQAYGRLHREGIAQTITAHFLNPGSGRFIHYRDLRSITVREAARFQSFNDDFVFCGNLQTQQKLVGNAVPPLMARALAEHFGKILSSI